MPTLRHSRPTSDCRHHYRSLMGIGICPIRYRNAERDKIGTVGWQPCHNALWVSRVVTTYPNRPET